MSTVPQMTVEQLLEETSIKFYTVVIDGHTGSPMTVKNFDLWWKRQNKRFRLEQTVVENRTCYVHLTSLFDFTPQGLK